jgi:DNA-binding NarL/FixJ family response regulator
MIQVVICSPIPALRAGLRALVVADPDLVVLGAGASLTEVAALLVEARVLVITADAFRNAGEIDLNPDLAVLLVTEDAHNTRLLTSLDLPAWGMISPEAPAESLQAAIQAVAEGLVAASPELVQFLLEQQPRLSIEPVAGGADSASPGDRLTGRETEVLQLLAQGLSNKMIALELNISEHTVKFHVSSIYSKMGVSNRAEAVRKGARRGWVPL